MPRPRDQLAAPAEAFARVAARAAGSEKDSWAWLTTIDRARRLELMDTLPANVPVAETPATIQTREALGLL